MIAIIPAAGKGTRMMSVTNGGPKELLRLGRKTILERVVQEAREAGADEIVIVNSPEKPAIDEVAHVLGARVAVQERMRGSAHAIATAGVDNDEALVLLGDCVFAGGAPTARMANLVAMGIDGVIAVEEVTDEEVRNYGITEVDTMGTITGIKEKPRPEETTSRYAVAGRYAFAPRFLNYLADYVATHEPMRQDEISVTEVIAAAIADGMDFKAVALQPGQQRVDCGSPEEYAQARRLTWEG